MAAELQVWVKSLYGGSAILDLRQKAEWFLIFEDVLPLPKRAQCWSDRVRSGLRSMPPEERALWVALFQTFSFTPGAKPGAKWFKAARPLLARIPNDLLRARYREWFGPFRDSQAVKLTIPGRDILRVLIWYALIAEDQEVDDAIVWFEHVNWQTKAARKCSAKALSAFCHTLAERNPGAARAVFERMIAKDQMTEFRDLKTSYQRVCSQVNP